MDVTPLCFQPYINSQLHHNGSTVRVGTVLLNGEVSGSHSDTISKTPLDEQLARRRDLRQHTTLTKDRHSSPPPPRGFEPAIPASDWLHTHTF